MAKEQILKMRIQLRRATTAEWEANKDVVPAAGEPCFDLDLGTLKIGDGVKAYEKLNAIGGVGTSGGVAVSADGNSIVLESNVFKLAGFDAAETGAQPRKAADGKLEWVVPVDVTALADRVTALEEKMDGVISEDSINKKIDAKINEFADKISDNGTVDTFKELVDYVASHGEEAANMAADIVNLQELVGDTPVADQIANAIAGIESGSGSGEENVIEKIYLGDDALVVADKTVTIPIGAGLLASDEITISTSGVLGVGTISVAKLVNDAETSLILDGGAAK